MITVLVNVLVNLINVLILQDLTHPDVGSSPLFTSVIRSLNSSCQQDVMLLNATLDVYMRIFNNLLHHSPHSAPLLQQMGSSEVENVKNIIKKIRKHISKRHCLICLFIYFQVDEPLVQRKALAELNEVDRAIFGLLHFRDSDH
uniref:Uncharacterized protein n=1 Tax=Periophthalmus magnuspinnatus TaxID=409849 RepID=A0A3B4AUK6_9GOBI